MTNQKENESTALLLDKESLGKIKDLIDFTNNWFEYNKDLVEKLKLRKNMLGFLGELETAKILSEKFKDKEIELYGGRKKGYDIEIKSKSGNPIKIQVKTSEKEAFRFLNLKNANKYKGEIAENYNSINSPTKFEMPKLFEKEIRNQIHAIDADYWVLVGWLGDKKQFFILTKEEIEEIAVKDYIRYMEHRKASTNKHNRPFNYGITKSGTIGIIVNYKNWKNNFDIWNDNWDKIN